MKDGILKHPAPPNTLFGGHKAVAPPDPIPNSAVKHSLADGSGFAHTPFLIDDSENLSHGISG